MAPSLSFCPTIECGFDRKRIMVNRINKKTDLLFGWFIDFDLTRAIGPVFI
jgi:hypothetical protein